MAPNRERGIRTPVSRKGKMPADAGRQPTAVGFTVPSSWTFQPDIPPQPSTMAAPAPIPWADIDALFADMVDYGSTSATDAAHQASEDTQTVSFEELLAGGPDYLGEEAGPSGGPQMLDAPHAAAPPSPSLFIDPRLLVLPPQLPSISQSEVGTIMDQAREHEEAIESLKRELDVCKSSADVSNKSLEEERERIAILEAQVASYHSIEERVEAQHTTIHELQKALSEEKSMANKLKTKYEQAQTTLHQRNSMYNGLQKTLDQKHAEIDSKEEQIKAQDEQIRQLTGDVKRHLASITMAEDEITRLGNVEKEKASREGSQRDQRRALKAKVETLEVELENTTEELEGARAEIKTLQVDCREKGYSIDRLEESHRSYVKVFNETVTLKNTLKVQDEDMVALKGNLQDLEEEIAKLRSRRRGQSSRSESGEEGEKEPVPGLGGYTTLEGVLEEDDDEDDHHGGEPAGPAEETGTVPEPNVAGGIESDEEEEAGGDAEVEGIEEEEVTRPVSVEPAERMVEVPTMVYCPWMWWKMPYQAFLLLFVVGGFPSVSAVFWKFVGFHLFAVNWPLVRSFGRHVDATPHSPSPRRLPLPVKVIMLLVWHLIVYASIGAVLWHLSLAMAERTMWLRANQLSRATLVGLRESLRQSPNFGNPVVRFTWRMIPQVAALERVVGRWLPSNRGVFG